MSSRTVGGHNPCDVSVPDGAAEGGAPGARIAGGAVTSGDAERLRFLGRILPASFEGRQVVIPPGGVLPFEEAEWRDTIVVVERGELELECLGGAGWTFRRGDILWLCGLPIRSLRHRGDGPVLLTAVTRRRRWPAP